MPFYFKADDDAESDNDQLMTQANRASPNQDRPIISAVDQIQGEGEEWPTSSQVIFSQHEDNTPGQKISLSGASSGLFLDESGELRGTTTTYQSEDFTDGTPRDYAGYANLQAQETRKAIKTGLGDADAYLQLPKSKLRGSRQGGPILSASRHPLNRQQDLKERDTIFKYAYFGCLGFMLFTGLLITLIYPSDVRDGLLKSPTVYRVIIESAKSFVSVIAFSMTLTVAWTFLMRQFTEPLVYGMLGSIPAACLLTSIWAVMEFYHKDPSTAIGKAYLYLLSIGGLVGAISSGAFIYWNKRTIKSTVEITKTASRILTENPTIYVATLFILLGYLLFVALWTGMFAHLLLLGHLDTIKQPEIIKEWHLSRWSYIFQAYFLFMLVWTTSIFSNLQKAMISGTVAKWYFYHEDPAYQSGPSPAMESLQETTSLYFGQICLGSLVISLVKCIRLGFEGYRRLTSRIQTRWANAVLATVNSFMLVVEKLFEHVSEFAIYYAPLSGESFCKSGRSVLRIFKRNTLLGVSTDFIARLAFTMTTVVVSILTGLGSYTFTSHVLKSQYGWVSGLLFGLLSWYILQIFADIYSDTLDVTFLCYAIDLDTEKVHSAEVYSVYASQHTPLDVHTSP